MKKSSERKKCSFLSEYERLTMLQSSCPLSHVIANIKENFIDMNADRIRLDEWDPIFSSLKVDDSLSLIALRSYWQVSCKDDGKKVGLNKKKPPIRSRSLTMRLASSLKDCLGTSKCLECLVLQNIPFRENDIRLLSKGIMKAHCLKNLSMENCRIGDTLFSVLGDSLKKSSTISCVDFTGCGLTWKSAELLAAVIKHQATLRNGEAWKASLRYRQPNFDQMLGLRRMTLNENNIGDEGARIFADAIKDDLWVKALDMQQCGVSTEGATILKDSLKYNKTLMVLDLRRNNLIEYTVLRSIIELLMVNAGGEHSDYPWLGPKDNDKSHNGGHTTYRKSSFRKRCYNRNGARRKSIEHRRSNTEHLPSRNTTERVKNKSNRRSSLPSVRQPVHSYRGTAVYGTSEHQLLSKKNSTAGDVHPPIRRKKNKKQSGLVVEQDIFVECLDNPDTLRSKQPRDSHSKETYLRIIDELCEELDSCKESVLREQQKRLEAEKRVKELAKERKLLQDKVDFYKMEAEKKEQPAQNPFRLPDLGVNENLLEDEKVLESIETSFKQFQQFLDMLKGIGLGDLCNQLTNPSNVREEKPVHSQDDSFRTR